MQRQVGRFKTNRKAWRKHWYPHDFMPAMCHVEQCCKCGRVKSNPMHSPNAEKIEFKHILKHGN